MKPPKRWKLVCKNGRPYSVLLIDPEGNAVPLVKEIFVSIDCEKEAVEVMYTQVAGVKLQTPRIEECVELDLEFHENTVIRALRVPKDAL